MTISASTPLRVVVLLTSVGLALTLLLTGTVAARAADDPGQRVTAQVQQTVVAGDTLWDIAASYTLPGDDVRVMVHRIKVHNGLASSGIVAGQMLVIPIEF